MSHLYWQRGAAGHWLAPIIALAAGTGMRRTELCQLRWSDVDLDARRLAVRQSKTEAGVRQLFLGDDVVAVLRDHLAEQQEHLRRIGVVWRADGYTFAPDPLHLNVP